MPQKYRQYPSSLKKNLQASKKPNHLRLIALIVAGLLLLLIPVFWIGQKDEQQNSSSNAQSSEPSFDKTQYTLDDPTSPWVVVNKQRPLNPKMYASAALRPPNMPLKGSINAENMKINSAAAEALETLVTEAQAEGLNFTLISGYRSYNTQKTIYDSEVKGFGQAIADTESARPGHSEHQTGWALDLGRSDGKCEIEACFADTPEGQWLAANAHTYGFIIRYAKDKTDVTGYIYEPWHLRYVGTDLSEEMHRTGVQTLEEFFNLPPAPTY